MISSSSRDCGYVGSLSFGLSTYPQPFRRPSPSERSLSMVTFSFNRYSDIFTEQ